jgi:hypothetical protein
MRDRVATVLFIFPDSREIRHMREPPRLGSRVRSARGAVGTVAQVIDYGSDTYAANCVGTSPVATVPRRAADPTNEEVKQRKRHRKAKDLAADLLARVKRPDLPTGDEKDAVGVAAHSSAADRSADHPSLAFARRRSA